MNYNDFQQEYLVAEKELCDLIKKSSSLEGKIKKALLRGDYKAVLKDKETLSNLIDSIKLSYEKVNAIIEAFDPKEFFASGAFAEDLLSCLKERRLDVIGTYPVYEVFPTRIRLDSESQDVILGKKKVPTISPSFLADTTHALISKLEAASFNATAFAQDLENAYNTCLLHEGKAKDGVSNVSLINCYKAMVPLARSRKEYDEMAFSFDLARLYNAIQEGSFVSKSGKKCYFGTGRGKAIRILDSNGIEQLISTVCFR